MPVRSFAHTACVLGVLTGCSGSPRADGLDSLDARDAASEARDGAAAEEDGSPTDVEAGDADPSASDGPPADAGAGDAAPADAADDAAAADDASTLPPNAFTAVQVLATDTHSTLALRADGDVYAWGNQVDADNGGYLAQNVRYATTPVKVAGLAQVQQIAARYYQFYALGRDGSVWGWGSGSLASFGQGQSANEGGSATHSTPVQFLRAPATPLDHVCSMAPTFLGLVMVRSESSDGSCSADTPKSVWFTGTNLVSGVAIPENLFAQPYAPLAPGGSPGSLLGTSWVEAVFTPTTNAADSIFVRLADGRVFGWGNNTHGVLGTDDTSTYPLVPTLLPHWFGVAQLAPSGVVTLGVFPDGRVLAAGDGVTGLLGDAASNGVRRAPSAVAGLSSVSYAAISESPPGAVVIDHGALFYWGTDSNVHAQPEPVPAPIASEAGPFTAVSLSSSHVAARGPHDAVYTWGADYPGQLGCGSCGAHTDPRLVTLP